MVTQLKVAAVNFVPWMWHKEWNANKLATCVNEPGNAGAELVVAPEGILEGRQSVTTRGEWPAWEGVLCHWT